MTDRALLQTVAESDTEAVGSSLAHSLAKFPVTIGLCGALGSGKTVFIRGFLRGLGIEHPIVSPTYALEQRYSNDNADVLHLDLYRLEQKEAMRLLHTSDDHHGIRCVEWPERAGEDFHSDILVTIEEHSDKTRSIRIECNDAPWPDDAMIDAWRKELLLPANIAAHCDAVAQFCELAAKVLHERGTFVRMNFVSAGGKVHDLFRFVDFQENAAPAGWTSTEEEQAVWKTWRERYPNATHEAAVEQFLLEKGYPELATLAASHYVRLPKSERTTTEQHLLYYADKRVIGSDIVSIKQRYDDFGQRYGKGTRSKESLQWEQDAVDTEKLLFPGGAPI